MSSNSARLGAVLEWATTFVDACAPDDMRIGVKVSLASAAAADPDTVATALAGLASDMAATLPATDPWRSVPPDAFGSVEDHTDLIPEFGDGDRLGADWPLYAVRGGLSPNAVSIVLGAFDRHELIDLLPDMAMADFGDAMRWLVFRRRSFTGDYVDLWVLKSAAYWVGRVDTEPGANREILDALHDRDIDKFRIDNDAYDPDARLAEDFAELTEDEVERLV
jgi:hypothetical protein